MSGRPFRPAPADFVRQAARLTTNQMCALYRAGSPIIKRWAAETGATPQQDPRGKQPTPADIAERAKEMPLTRLARHYGFTDRMMRRMLDQAGVECIRYDQRTPKNRKPRASRPAAFRSTEGPTLCTTLRRDTTPEGRAADHLRHYAPVYRCTERGGVPENARPDDPRLTHWRYGQAVLTADELIERAARRGFDAGAWRRLAA